MMKMHLFTAAATATLLLAGCQQEAADPQTDVATVADSATPAAAAEAGATAMLQTADGQSAGQARITPTATGLDLVLDVTGIAPGNHGVHIHQTGQCDAPDFKSAGGHWNPTNKQHGLANDAGSHMGDFVNLEVTADGTGHLERPIAGATLEGGDTALLDADGAAFVIHAGADDQKTDPSGDSGDRLACGVFQKAAG